MAASIHTVVKNEALMKKLTQDFINVFFGFHFNHLLSLLKEKEPSCLG
jgi:hypothetical protein